MFGGKVSSSVLFNLLLCTTDHLDEEEKNEEEGKDNVWNEVSNVSFVQSKVQTGCDGDQNVKHTECDEGDVGVKINFYTAQDAVATEGEGIASQNTSNHVSTVSNFTDHGARVCKHYDSKSKFVKSIDNQQNSE